MDWSDDLDLGLAVKNLRIEMPNDWHQDPWGWPELGYLLKHGTKLVYQHCDGASAQEAALLDVPKENWSSRPAVVLDILDRVVYQALVDNVSLDLIGDLSPNTFGWRLRAKDPSPGDYSHNNRQWSGYTGHLQLLAGIKNVALKTDIVSFFSSVPIDAIKEAIEGRATSLAHVIERLCDLLEGFQLMPNRAGLPQRSSASAVLANMYLIPLDDLLRSHSSPLRRKFRSGVQYHSFARWMDDIWLFSSDAAQCRRAQVELQSEALSLGLYLNAAKTDVLEGDEVAEQALEIEHSAVDNSIDTNENFAPLEELIDRLLDSPEKASRTSIRFATTRMRDNNHRYRIQEILELAPRMPHVADACSRLFREVFRSSSLQDWYLDYATGDWSTYQWSVAHFGRMFPSSRPPRKALREYFSTVVRDANTTLPLLAVAAQRLCAWDEEEGRAACRDAYRRAGSPHARRILALSALGAGESRTTIRRWLRVDKENYPTIQMLEHYNYSPLKVTADFAGNR